MTRADQPNDKTRKSSILFIWNKDIRNPGAGGGTIELHAVMKHLADKGYSVTQVAGNFPGGKKEENVEGVKILRMGSLYSMPFFLWKNQLTSRFLDKYDVVVEGLGYVSLLLPMLTRRKLLVICAHLPKEIFLIEGPLALGKPLGYIVGGFARFIESIVTPIVYRDATIFTFSDSTRRDMIETGFPEKNVFMVPYALAHYTTQSDDSLKQMSALDLESFPRDKPNIVCIGRLRKYKGVQDLIRAVPRIRQAFPDVTVKIVGRGQYEDELKELTRSLNIEDHVTFSGYISTREKFQLIASSQLLVMPSYREGFATPVFEAQMCGAVPVVSDAEGVKDLIIPGKTGVVFRRGDPEDLARRVIEMFGNKELRERIRKEGYQAVMEIDWRANETKFLDLFEEKINEGPRSL